MDRATRSSLAWAVVSAGVVMACVGSDPASTGGTTPLPDAGADVSDPASADVWIDPAKGDDARDGRRESEPLKTLKKGLRAVLAGGTIHLAAGIYDSGTGEDFAKYEVPAGVTITTPQRAGATVVGPGTGDGLRFLDGGKLVNVKLTAVETAVVIGAAKVDLVGVDIADVRAGVVVTGTGEGTLTSCGFGGKLSSAVQTNQRGHAIIRKSSFQGLQPMTDGTALTVLSAYESSTLEIFESTIEVNQGGVASVHGSAKLSTVATSITGNTNGNLAIIQIDAAAATLTLGPGTQISGNSAGVTATKGTVTVDSAVISFNGEVGLNVGGPAKLSVRRSKVTDHTVANVRVLHGGAAPYPQIDLGDAAKGNGGANEFTVTSESAFGLFVSLGDVEPPLDIPATGNFWSDTVSGKVAATTDGSKLAKVYNLLGTGYSVSF